MRKSGLGESFDDPGLLDGNDVEVLFERRIFETVEVDEPGRPIDLDGLVDDRPLATSQGDLRQNVGAKEIWNRRSDII